MPVTEELGPHYNTQFDLNLGDADKKDLIEYLEGI